MQRRTTFAVLRTFAYKACMGSLLTRGGDVNAAACTRVWNAFLQRCSRIPTTSVTSNADLGGKSASCSCCRNSLPSSPLPPVTRIPLFEVITPLCPFYDLESVPPIHPCPHHSG